MERKLPIDLSSLEDRNFSLQALLGKISVLGEGLSADYDDPRIDELLGVIGLANEALGQAYIESGIQINLEKKRADEAARDTLTGIYERKAIDKFIKPMLDSSGDDEPFFVLFCDLVGLGSVNNEFGHNQGDYLINSLADAITLSTGTYEHDGEKRFRGASDNFVVMRWGGDEFVVFGRGDDSYASELIEAINLSHRLIMNKSKRLDKSARRGLKFGHGQLRANTMQGFEDALDDADPKGPKKVFFTE